MSSFGDKAKQVLATVAPWIGTALGGPVGTAAGEMLAKALGTKPGDTAAAEAALLTASPETLAKLRQAEMDFKEKMRELDISEEKLTFDDINSARSMAVQTKDTTPRNLAYLLLGGTAVAIGATLAGYTHVDSALAGTLIGYMISECKAIMAYYFGSSRGSQDKDSTIADMAKAA